MIHLRKFNENIGFKDRDRILYLFTAIEDKYGAINIDAEGILFPQALDRITNDSSLICFDYAHNDTNNDECMEIAVYFNNNRRTDPIIINLKKDVEGIIERLKTSGYMVEKTTAIYRDVDEICLTITKEGYN